MLVADTTSVALAKLLGAALAARPDRHVVVSSSDNFPSDLYAAAAVARRARVQLKAVDPSHLAATLNELADDVAVCCLTQVDFPSGAILDLPTITDAVHAVAALAMWDLCHSAGVVPVDCERNGVDLAVGCTYKYPSAGPGAPSFLYVRRALQESLDNPLPGWLGHAEPFEFDLRWEPAHGIRKFLTSTPSILPLSVLDTALKIFEGVTIEQIRAKSALLGELFVAVVDTAGVRGLEVASPRDPQARGAQVSLRPPRAPDLLQSLAGRGVVGDLRPPSLCRFGLTPLALSFEDVFHGASTVADAARALE